MSDDGGLGDAVEIGNPAEFLTGFAEAGYSARAALDAFREAGGSMGNERFRSLYAQVQDTIARRPEVAAFDYDTLPTGDQYGTIAMGRGGQFVTKVQLSFADRDTGDILTNYYTFISDDPHTPGEAVAGAMEQFGEPEASQRYRTTLIGGLVTSMSMTTAYQR